MRTVYWAAADVDVLGGKVEDRFRRYRQDLFQRRRGQRIYEATLRYYGYDPDDGLGDSSTLEFGGEQGEAVLAHVNHYRSLVRSMRSLATSSRPAYDATAEDDTAESAVACELAEQIWNYELETGLERALGRADERMLVQSESTIAVFWEPDRGRVVGTSPVYEVDADGNPVMEQVSETSVASSDGMLAGEFAAAPQPKVETDGDGNPRLRAIHEGAICYEVFGPGDVARDPEWPDMETLPWVILRRRFHRWELLAGIDQSDPRYNKVLGMDGVAPQNETRPRTDDTVGPDLTDVIYGLELYHERTAAVPEGRYARVVAGEVLEEGPLQYESIPGIVSAPSLEFDRASGYTDTWDLMGLSKAIDMAVGDLISYCEKFGDLVARIPEGADIDAGDMLGPGAVKYKWERGMPLPDWMPVPSLNDGIMKFLEWMEKTLQVMSGVNSVVRGDPEASLKSGAALALVQAMAVKHSSEFQSVAADMRRAVATKVVEVYRAFATTERLIEVAGEHERGTVRAFRGEDLRPVRRIRVELANPLMRTIAGKKELADVLLTQFPNEQPIMRAQYLAFLNSGRLPDVFQPDQLQHENAKFARDRLLRGEEHMPMVSDHHELMIQMLSAAINGRARYELDPNVIMALQNAVLTHDGMWMQLSGSNPGLLAATNQRPHPGMAMGGPPPGGGPPMGPGGPPPPGGPDIGLPPPGGEPPPMPGAGVPPEQMPSLPSMPQMPGGGPAPIGDGAMG